MLYAQPHAIFLPFSTHRNMTTRNQARADNAYPSQPAASARKEKSIGDKASYGFIAPPEQTCAY